MSPSFVSRRLVFPWLVRAGLSLLLLSPAGAFGQSAADKAAARQLAVDGINLYKEGNYAAAIDRLARAQQLYDAHVHLLYIGRTQSKLGKLVEAAEAYRTLARKPLPPDASDVVKNAKLEGARELAELEPRIPTLRIDVEPKDAQGLELTINGEPVPAAAIGINRPVNPGQVVVQVGGEGWKTAEASVQVPEAGKQSLTIKLEKGPPTPEAGRKGADAGGEAGAETPEEAAAPDYGILLGLRLGGTVPFGTLRASAPGIETTSVRNLVDGGGGGELRLGFRFREKFTGLVSAEGYSLKARPRGPGSQFGEIALIDLPPEASAKSTPFGYRVGLGFMYTRITPGLDWFVEGTIAYQGITSNTTVTIDPDVPDDTCKRDIDFSGGVLRATAGVVFPLARFFSIHPYGGFSLGSFAQGSISGDCGTPTDLDVKGVQGWATLGIGGDFVIPVRD